MRVLSLIAAVATVGLTIAGSGVLVNFMGGILLFKKHSADPAEQVLNHSMSLTA